MTFKPPIAVDFDDCIFDKENERLYPGTEEFLRSLNKKYYVVIFTARCGTEKGKKIVHEFLHRHKLMGVVNEITYKKHLNFVAIIDNKAIKCCGTEDYAKVLEEVGV